VSRLVHVSLARQTFKGKEEKLKTNCVSVPDES
jgi:hypothetical protein